MAPDDPSRPFQRRYPPELRERAIRLVFESAAEQGERHSAVGKVAEQLGIGAESLRQWVRQAEIDRGERGGLTTEERERIQQLERENRELRRPTRTSRARRFSSGRSSTAARRDDYVHRRAARSLGSRADLPDPGDRPVQLLRGEVPTAACSEPRHAELGRQIAVVHQAHFSVYGVRKLWRKHRREGEAVWRDQVGRLMRALGLAGATRTKRIRTTKPAVVERRPADLVERVVTASAPNRLWVADLTYVWTRAGFVYTAFVIDAFSRAIVGWRVLASLRAELALDALEMAIWNRRDEALTGLVHHSDRGVQYLSIRYAERLAEAEAASSVGSKGDSYDNALAETVNGLHKTELIKRHKPWRAVEQVDLGTAAWVDWWNTRRLYEACGDVPPAEFEAAYHQRLQATGEAA